MLVIGDSEVENGAVAVRRRGEDGDLGAMNTADFINMAVEEIDTKAIK
jgi:threonyl-tRNA synthetase